MDCVIGGCGHHTAEQLELDASTWRGGGKGGRQSKGGKRGRENYKAYRPAIWDHGPRQPPFGQSEWQQSGPS